MPEDLDCDELEERALRAERHIDPNSEPYHGALSYEQQISLLFALRAFQGASFILAGNRAADCHGCVPREGGRGKFASAVHLIYLTTALEHAQIHRPRRRGGFFDCFLSFCTCRHREILTAILVPPCPYRPNVEYF